MGSLLPTIFFLTIFILTTARNSEAHHGNFITKIMKIVQIPTIQDMAVNKYIYIINNMNNNKTNMIHIMN